VCKIASRLQAFRTLTGLLLFAGLLLLGVPGVAGADTFSNFGVPAPVADATGPGGGPYVPGLANPFPSVTNVFGMTGVVTGVQVAVIGLEHHNVDDLNLLLVAPNGNGIQLMSDAGGNAASASTGVTLFFQDDASGTIPDDGPFVGGVYKPVNYFGGLGEDSYFATTGNTGDVYPAPAPSAASWASNTTLAQAFNGAAPNGNWSLYITDDNGNGLTGGLDAAGAYWGLTITTGLGAATTPIPSPNAKFSIAKSSTNKFATTFDASASLPAGAVADSFKWDLNSDGTTDAQCPGPDPILTTKFDASGSVNATLTVNAGGATSTSRLSSPVVGIASGKRVSKSSQSGSYTRQTFICAPISGRPPPPNDLTAGGGPPQECTQSVEFDIVEAIGCFTTAESLTSIPSAERSILSNVASGFAGTDKNVRIGAVNGTVPVSSLVTTQQRIIEVSTQPVRLNGLDFYPKPGAAIVLVSPVTKGLLLPESMPGYILSSGADVKIGGITLQSGSLRLPLGFAGIRAKAHLGDFTLSKAPLIGDLPIQGKIGVDLAFRRTEIPINVSLPGIFKSASGESVSGSALLTADNANGILLDQLHLRVPHASVAGLGIDDLDFTYKRADATWDASATVSFPPGASISARVLIQNGALQYIFVHAVPPNPGIHSAPGVFITYLDFNYDGRNGTAFGGGIGVAAGPKVATPYGQCSLIGVDGHFLLNVADPVSYRADGDVRWLCIHLVHGYYLANTDGYFELGGDAVLKIADDLEFSARLKVGAQFTVDHAQVDAELNACVKFWIAGGCVGAEIVASDVGIGICADLGFTHAGGGIVFPTKVLLFADSCDISRFRSLDKFAKTSAASGTQSFKWGPGKPSGLVAVTGNGAPPAFTLTGPGGRTIHASATEKLPDHVVINRALDNTTYLFVRTPAAGTWKVTADAGSAVTNVQVADGLPAPEVTGKVVGSGRSRALAYEQAPQPGQSVDFSLQGKNTSVPIGKARGSHGKLKIKIPATSAGKLNVVANVRRGSLPRENISIATFKVRALTLPAPKRLSLSRKGSKIKLSWAGVEGATSYLVTFKLSDGNRSQIKTAKRKLTLGGLPPSAHGKIFVQAVPDLGKSGAKRSAALKSIRAPRVKP
jgi:subtilisin-like proprotein convertase family protein